jgi:hypothetical protein
LGDHFQAIFGIEHITVSEHGNAHGRLDATDILPLGVMGPAIRRHGDEIRASAPRVFKPPGHIDGKLRIIAPPGSEFYKYGDMNRRRISPTMRAADRIFEQRGTAAR